MQHKHDVSLIALGTVWMMTFHYLGRLQLLHNYLLTYPRCPKRNYHHQLVTYLPSDAFGKFVITYGSVSLAHFI